MTQDVSGKRERIDVGPLTFDVALAGGAQARPVLLLHGFPETARSWDLVSARLVAAGLRTIAPNQRGYSPGARPDGAEQYGVAHLVADAVGIIDALGLSEVDVVGHDWGSVVAWHLAGWHPERVRTLTAVSVPHPAAFGWALRNDADQQRRSEYIKLFRQEGKAEQVLLADGAKRLRAVFSDGVPAELVDEHVRVLSEPGALTAALNWYRAMSGDMRELGDVTVPTTYVWSTEDGALGRAGALRCGDHVAATYRFVQLEGVSHWIPEEAPDALAEAVLQPPR
ncbi:alpha/beta hydrolase [Saccharopolyspora shandongensis]|uniref:alpha/beta fold hydrolase n=1 Tax=Saccharopolyspora shandongensis TaxID=418495 RepID=UPI003433D24F